MFIRLLLLMCVKFWYAESKVLDWPGKNAATNADKLNEFSVNLSGLFYDIFGSNDSEKFMFAIQNYPSTLYKLYWSGKNWLPIEIDGWSKGKPLHFSGGKGNPDSEDLTMTSEGTGFVYVASEKDNDDDVTKRISVLMFDNIDKSSSLSASKEWILSELNAISTNANNGIEAITWIPDDFLVANKFFDDARKSVYDPSKYLNHGTGLFFVGMEGNIYAYALNHDDTATSPSSSLITSFPSGEINIMSLYFDADTGYLWAGCDNTCDGRMNVHTLSGSDGGVFRNAATLNRPTSLGNFNNEGFALLPESSCDAEGYKAVFWADDDCDGGHAVYQDTIPCGKFLDNLVRL